MLAISVIIAVSCTFWGSVRGSCQIIYSKCQRRDQLAAFWCFRATNGVLNKPVLRVAAEDGALSGGAARRPVPRNLTDSDLPEQPSATPLVVISGGKADVCRMTSSQPRESPE